jgi:hypothetical protein
MTKMLALLTAIALFGSAGTAGAGQAVGPVRLTSGQMDTVAAGAGQAVGPVRLFIGRMDIVAAGVLINSAVAMMIPVGGSVICPSPHPIPLRKKDKGRR